MYWRTVLSPSRRRTPPPPPAQNTNRPGPTPYPYTLTNPVLSQFEFPSANSTPNGTPSGSEVDHDHDQDGDGEQEEGVQKSGRAGNRRRQKYSRTRTGCLSCRTRRIKCDEARPVCKRCIIAKKTVSYVSYIVENDKWGSNVMRLDRFVSGVLSPRKLWVIFLYRENDIWGSKDWW